MSQLIKFKSYICFSPKICKEQSFSIVEYKYVSIVLSNCLSLEIHSHICLFFSISAKSFLLGKIGFPSEKLILP